MRRAALALCVLVTTAANTAAEPDDGLPLWEIGVVGGGGWVPDYPAADESRFQGIALPYAIYRGEIFRLGDRGAARGIIADQERFELDLGVAAAFSVDSGENDAREGMDGLDYLLQLGPRFTWRFLPGNDHHEIDLELAARAVISTDVRNWRYQGIALNPALTYRRNDLLGRDLNAVFWISSLFGFDGLNDYFYEVDPAESRPGRPAYNADDGYIGTEFTAGLSWGITEKLRAFGGVQLGYWNGSANEDSPLFREDLTVTVGGGLRWSIFMSGGRVPR